MSKRVPLDRLMQFTPTLRGRRAFLKGAGAVAVGLPFLELTAGAARAAPGDHPQRLLILSMGHSMDVNGGYDDANLLPVHNNGVLTAASPVLQALTPHLDKCNYFWGIDNLVAQSLSSNGHNASGRTVLAYAPHAGANYNGDGSLVTDQNGFSLGQVSAGPQAYPTGPSINCFLADRMGSPRLNLSVGGDHGEHARDFYTSQNGAGDPIILRDPVVQNPATAFDGLFAGVGEPVSQTTIDRLRRKKGSVLDAVLGQFNTLMNTVGAEDRARLDRHATHLRQV